jgi:hypothetical protein
MESNNSDKLNKLQDVLIDELLRRVSTGEATAADLGAARQLLKDNGVQAIAVDNSPLADLINTLPFDDGTDNVKMING